METKFKKFLHKYYLFTELILLVALVPFIAISVSGEGVRGESRVVAGVQSHIVVEHGDESYEFSTYKNNVLDAVTEQGIRTYEQDGFSINRNAELYGQDVRLEITKSLPVLIYDNTKRIWGRTIHSNPEKILEQNNIKYWPEDVLESELIQDPIKEAGIGQLVRITRAPVINIKVDGEIKEIRTWGLDVNSAIEKAEIKINPNDIVKPGLKEYINDGDIVIVTRINYAEVSTTESIDFNTIYKGSTSLALGQSTVSQSGIAGQKKNTYRITYKDGEEVSRVLLSFAITKVKQDRVVIRGAVIGKCKWGKYYETNSGPYTTAFHYALSDRRYIGRYILVTNLSNGKGVKVRVVDAGPTNGLLDLSTTAINAIGGMNDIYIYGYISNVMVQLID